LENVKITEEKQKLESRVKELEAEIGSLQAGKTASEGAAVGHAESAKQIAEQAATIVS
jgi:nucleoprotein TPR